jgi:hypothetical protein
MMSIIKVDLKNEYGDWCVEGFQDAVVDPKPWEIENGEHINLPFVPVGNQTYFVVIAVYHDGNTFHHDNNAHCACVDMFTTVEAANFCRDALLQADKLMWKNKFSRYDDKVTWKREDGSDASYMIPWTTVFTTLSYVEVGPVMKQDPKLKLKLGRVYR